MSPRNEGSARLFWRLHDHFRSETGDWRTVRLRWELRAPIQVDGATWQGHAVIEVRKLTPKARAEVLTSVSVERSHTGGLDSEPGPLRSFLRGRGYQFDADGCRASKRTLLPSRAPSVERRFLSRLFGRRDPLRRPHAVSGFNGMSKLFRGAVAGGWRPAGAGFELRRPIRTPGHQTESISMLHLFEDTPLGSTRSAALMPAASITIWPPWRGRGTLPTWLGVLRPWLTRQYRSIGHRSEWHEGPAKRGVMITSWKEGLRGFEGLVGERRRLEALRLGHPGSDRE